MITSAKISEKMMVSVVNKVSNQEKTLDMHLMQLCLVDIATGKNSKYRVTDENQGQSAIIQHILNSKVSYRLIFSIIRMSSINFLKPF
jgi:hypothetical protein